MVSPVPETLFHITSKVYYIASGRCLSSTDVPVFSLRLPLPDRIRLPDGRPE